MIPVGRLPPSNFDIPVITVCFHVQTIEFLVFLARGGRVSH